MIVEQGVSVVEWLERLAISSWSHASWTELFQVASGSWSNFRLLVHSQYVWPYELGFLICWVAVVGLHHGCQLLTYSSSKVSLNQLIQLKYSSCGEGNTPRLLLVAAMAFSTKLHFFQPLNPTQLYKRPILLLSHWYILPQVGDEERSIPQIANLSKLVEYIAKDGSKQLTFTECGSYNAR